MGRDHRGNHIGVEPSGCEHPVGIDGTLELDHDGGRERRVCFAGVAARAGQGANRRRRRNVREAVGDHLEGTIWRPPDVMGQRPDAGAACAKKHETSSYNRLKPADRPGHNRW